MKEKIINIIKTELKKLDIEENIIVETPKNKENGDYSTNIALKLAKTLKDSPMNIANKLIENINDPLIEKVIVANPGFINFFVKKDYLLENIDKVINENENYGSSKVGNGKKINIEFVSANPTGTLHIGNARGGAYGDSLARIMRFCGYDVTKEYYVNDAGNQINKLGKSILSRYLDLCNIENEFPENGYQGEEIKTIAKEIFDEYGNSLTEKDLELFKDKGTNYLTDAIFNDLKEYSITYDIITSERSIYKKYPVDNFFEEIKDYLYTKDGATWFKSSELCDTEDHVFIKEDGNFTYVVPDILYHKDKLQRGYDKIIDVLGTDHHGYIARLKSGIKSVGEDPDKLEVKLLQLVRLVKNGESVAMHKRTGNIVTLKDLINEVGVNAARYYFSKTSLDTQMDFDIELAKSKSSENPVYYVCYAYARVCSILNKYENIEKVANYEYINDEDSYNVLSAVYRFTEVVQNACQKEMPHIVTNYIYELASLLHNYYEKVRIITDNQKQTLEHLLLLKTVQITLKNALYLIGVEPSERM